MEKGRLLSVLGCILAVCLVICSLIVIGTFGGAGNNHNKSCQDLRPRERTYGMGVATGVMGLLFGGASFAMWLLPLVKSTMDTKRINTTFKLTQLSIGLLVALFYLVAWALMAKEMDDLIICNTPGMYNPPPPNKDYITLHYIRMQLMKKNLLTIVLFFFLCSWKICGELLLPLVSLECLSLWWSLLSLWFPFVWAVASASTPWHNLIKKKKKKQKQNKCQHRMENRSKRLICSLSLFSTCDDQHSNGNKFNQCAIFFPLKRIEEPSLLGNTYVLATHSIKKILVRVQSTCEHYRMQQYTYEIPTIGSNNNVNLQSCLDEVHQRIRSDFPGVPLMLRPVLGLRSDFFPLIQSGRKQTTIRYSPGHIHCPAHPELPLVLNPESSNNKTLSPSPFNVRIVIYRFLQPFVVVWSKCS